MGYPDLRRLTVCRNLLEDAVINKLVAIRLKEQEEPVGEPDRRKAEIQILRSELAALLVKKAETLGLSGNILSSYMVHCLAEGSNTAADIIEATGAFGKGLVQAMSQDMQLLIPFIQAKTSAGAAKALLAHYKKWGSGMLARYTAFRIGTGGTLIGIADFPVFKWDDLLGYEDQKYKLLTNTQNFMEGRPANNVLLTGARGTGKSTGVKALAAMFAADGLRLIQITRDQLELVSPVLEKLNEIRSKKFILFFDDLSFDEGESSYKYLKSAIDGSVTAQPDNVLIYATSNRRHLLKETWSDRNDALEAEVYRQDSANESISLSDRFGLILHYSMPSQDEYLQIIDHELRKAGVRLSPEELRLEGIRWEMEHSGRNGRIANQFVKWYLGNLEE